MTSIYDWSLDAAANANADTLINWAEGQPPSSVNDSARAMMQRLAEYLADQGGTVLASGSANALNLMLHVPVVAYHDGIMVRFRATGSNNGAVTINVNNIGARPVFLMRSTGIAPLEKGEIQPSGIYDIIYVQALSSGAGGWLLINPTSPQTIPAGFVASFACDVPPPGWLECDGAQISRSTYANLFASIGTHWGAGNGVTTFHLPDLRGQFLRGWDHGRGLDSGRSFASLQGDQNKLHDHGGWTMAAGSHNHTFTVPMVVAGSGGSIGAGSVMKKQEEVRTTQMTANHQHQIVQDGGSEARPRNMAVLYAIKW